MAVGDFEGYVHFLKREDGSFAARTQPDSGPITAPPVVSGDSVLLVQTRRGGLYALTVK